MNGTLVVLDAHDRAERYGWLVSEEYCSTLLHADTWGSALRGFAPAPDVLLVASLTDRDAAAVASIVRVGRALGVRVVCDGSRTGEVLLRAAVAAGATGWDGSAASAGAAFAPPVA
ncbi:hypothetical protein HUN58_12060 [Curtobacterium sp. Csp1]|uniref:Response regulatory domain-containing protein n=1 Tax=Curtobacterium citreum TaxID=2036 RepID=A0A850DYS9_9MICO|nr:MULTISPECIES: hypothetical protein [Curtobacterium]KTR22387.1 hypothetical protein NS330_04330 [Curtobacterium citreum]MCS6521656.1 hypothetical protein [Curtobacterium citreum]NUU29959.1 hypothetical protein [Curtobacterium albidum]QKS13228.1 hypothetical protein HUN60_08815 [Curtobacterium sp. csp3]QKS17406.1 hypothetical protein HUN59_15395 [Curtobacterium sp. Csp2]